MQGVATPSVGGVVLHRSPLQAEAKRALGIARRVGRRLMRWVRAVEDTEVKLFRVIGRDPVTGLHITEPVNDKDGKQIIVPVLPDEDFRKSWELYERTVRNLLAEQRARAAMATSNGAPAVSDEEFDTQIRELARQAILEMPREDLEALLAQRRSWPVPRETAAVQEQPIFDFESGKDD